MFHCGSSQSPDINQHQYHVILYLLLLKPQVFYLVNTEAASHQQVPWPYTELQRLGIPHLANNNDNANDNSISEQQRVKRLTVVSSTSSMSRMVCGGRSMLSPGTVPRLKAPLMFQPFT